MGRSTRRQGAPVETKLAPSCKYCGMTSNPCLVDVNMNGPPANTIGVVPEGFQQSSMEHYDAHLGNHESIMVCQTAKGCCARMCCGCEPRQEFTVHERINGSQGNQVFHILEETNCCTRCCCGGNRNWSMQMNL